MADVKKCDRCGVYFEKYPGCTLKHHWLDLVNFDPVYDNFDICTDCCTEFEEFMRGAKPKNLLERVRRMVCKE